MSGTSGIRIVDMPDLGAVSSNSRVVGEHAGSGTFLATALQTWLAQTLATQSYVTNIVTTLGGVLTTTSAAPGYPYAPGFDGNNWAASPVLWKANQSGPHAANAQYGFAVQHSTDGSGTNGPLYSDGGLMVASAKNSWKTSQVQGEVDGIYVFNYQGALGDSAALLLGNTKVDGGSSQANYGGLAAEWNSSLAAPTTGATTLSIQGMLGWLNSGSTVYRYGYSVEARLGAANAAVLIDQFDTSSGAAPPSWQWSILAQQNRSVSNRTFGVDAVGNVWLGRQPANSRPIQCQDTTGSIVFLKNDGTTMTHAFSNTGDMQITGQLSPAVDNTKSLGASGFRWTAVWASNGTIQTSDPALKTDIAPLPASLPLLMAIHPITFRWIDGGAEDGDSDAMMEVDEDREMQATETASEEIEQVEMVNGRPVLRRVMQTTERPVFDSFPVLDANGNPVTVKMRVGAELRDVPRFHQVPRMERRSVKVVRPATAPGRRTHWGFSAPEVKAAFDALGMDFGGYVKAQDGSQHLRPDQLIPVLWQVCRELADKVAALEAAASR